MAEITDAGFVGTSQNEYFERETNLYLTIDPSWNLDPSTPDGLKVAHDAERFGNLDEVARIAYNSKNPNAARDLELDLICAITGTVRRQGTPSTAVLTLTGVAGTVIPGGSLVESTIDGSQWAIDATVVIPAPGTIDTQATAAINGATQAEAGSITQIVDTVGGWQTANNANVATPGNPRETNAQLRLRRAVSVGKPGDNQVDSMRGEIGAVDGVRRFAVYENDTNAPDGDGLPAHSLAVFADGGTDDDVALAIYLKKNPGVLLFSAGDPVSVVVTSPRYPNQTQTINFSRPFYVDVALVVDVIDDGSLPNDADQRIKDAILLYVNGGDIPPEVGFNSLGFDIGENVPISRMYTPINQVLGSYGNSYISDLTLNGVAANLTINFNQLSRWTEVNLTVNIT